MAREKSLNKKLKIDVSKSINNEVVEGEKLSLDSFASAVILFPQRDEMDDYCRSCIWVAWLWVFPFLFPLLKVPTSQASA